MDRELTEYPHVYCNPVVFTVYGHCLLNAAYREKYYAGILLQPGQFITSYAAMANECGITERQARNAFERLEESHLIERKPVGKGRKSGTLVTVANSQFVVIGENEVGLKTSDNELRTYLQQGNYLINNKKEEEKEQVTRDQSSALIENGILSFMMKSGFLSLPTERKHLLTIRQLLSQGYDPDLIYDEIKAVVDRSKDRDQEPIHDALAYLVTRLERKENGWSYQDNE